ncbi:ImmA/IrrE family metallo-endopeptidase [Campylobacter showae]|uniref:ImmA/IrrE family metallo-endopeptidase n=1 Tax=Campylobacter showae TaxID=204 RepID=UPI000F08CB1F|nr:ImmA/IrrE family metallo-endopeptidase [Campylobacter showae]
MADYTRATAEAKKLLSGSRANLSRPVNLAIILNEQGLSAQYKDGLIDEALLNPMERTIYIRRDDKPMTRKLFSIAHEIGHWMLHSRDKERPRINFSDNPAIDEIVTAEEQEANAFAAELLMPYDEVRNFIVHGYNIEYLMAHFNVSYEFAYYRYNFIISMIY